MRIAPASHLALAACLLIASRSSAQQRPAAQPAQAPEAAQAESLRNERREDPHVAPARHEGEGPYARLIIRGATLIDGLGGPPRSPVDIVIENNRVTSIANVGYPGVPI